MRFLRRLCCRLVGHAPLPGAGRRRRLLCRTCGVEYQ